MALTSNCSHTYAGTADGVSGAPGGEYGAPGAGATFAYGVYARSDSKAFVNTITQTVGGHSADAGTNGVIRAY